MFYLCVCNPLMMTYRETERYVLSINYNFHQGLVVCHHSLKTHWRTLLTGLKKGEEIFHLEVVSLIFCFVRTDENLTENNVNNTLKHRERTNTIWPPLTGFDLQRYIGWVETSQVKCAHSQAHSPEVLRKSVWRPLWTWLIVNLDRPWHSQSS